MLEADPAAEVVVAEYEKLLSMRYLTDPDYPAPLAKETAFTGGVDDRLRELRKRLASLISEEESQDF
jgi:hypothetical protein